MNFNNKHILVTGASRGIGRAVAIAFAKQGARVAVHFHHNHTAAEQTLQQMDGNGHFSIQADISKPEDIEKLVKTTLEKLGRIDVLVNNAGIFEYHPLANMNYAEWQSAWKQTIDTNLIGPANLGFPVAPTLTADANGTIGQSPLKRTATPEEIAKTVLFLASGDADYITGAIVDVNGASYLRN